MTALVLVYIWSPAARVCVRARARVCGGDGGWGGRRPATLRKSEKGKERKGYYKKNKFYIYQGNNK